MRACKDRFEEAVIEKVADSVSCSESLHRMLEHTLDDPADVYAFGFGAVIDEDAVAEDGCGEGDEIFAGDVGSTVQ